MYAIFSHGTDSEHVIIHCMHCFLQIMLWMMFGCKYVNQTLEALGSDHADQRGIIQLLNDLQQMECLLPD